MQLSVCIIAKNEEKNIRRCLESLKSYDVEIIVADTGSVDRTREIALEYTGCVYGFEWCDDFAAAKNFAISKASNPYVLVLDCDEYIEELDMAQLTRLIMEHPDEVGRIQRHNILTKRGMTGGNYEWISRIFAREIFFYEGRIHEQVTARSHMAYRTYRAPVTIGHTGYDLTGEDRRRKTERNRRLLNSELERLKAAVARGGDDGQVDEQLPYILYQLGKSCYMAGDYLDACGYFSEGLSYDLEPRLEYVVDMVETYGYALLNSGQAESALSFENIYDTFAKTADFHFLMGLIYMNNALYETAIEEFTKATTYRECRSMGVNSYAAYYNIGVILECLDRMEEARNYYGQCGEYEPAEKRLAALGMD